MATSSREPSARLNALEPDEHCLSMEKDTEKLSTDYKGNPEGDVRQLVIPDAQGGQRLDQALSSLLPEFSRNRIQNWIRARKIAVDDAWGTTKMKVTGGESVRVEIEPDPNATPDAPEAIPLNVVFEDQVLLVVNKPVGLVVHPGSGNRQGTLLNALLHWVPQVAELPRAGIVHRLDKDTSGVILVAKNDAAQRALQAQFKARQVQKTYLALVFGQMTPAEGEINAAIGRDVRDRKRMAVVPLSQGRPAVTRYETLDVFTSPATGERLSLLSCQPLTGRTHQIRVHLAHVRHPIVGDETYGGRRRLPAPCPRQFLHAHRLRFYLPATGEAGEFTAPLPEDLLRVLEHLA